MKPETALFLKCILPHCEGGVWRNIYNLGGSHGRIGDGHRHLGNNAFDVPLPDRRKIMLEMLEYQTRYKPDKRAKRAVKGRKGQ